MVVEVAELIDSFGFRARLLRDPHNLALPGCFMDLRSATRLAFHQSPPPFSGLQLHQGIDSLVRRIGRVKAQPGKKTCFAVTLR